MPLFQTLRSIVEDIYHQTEGWAVTTLTAVRYGDIYPLTIEGRTWNYHHPTGIMTAAMTKISQDSIADSDDD